MERYKIEEVRKSFKIGQVLKLQANNEGRGINVDGIIRNGRIIFKTKDFITVQYRNLGHYKKSFNYADFITGVVQLVA